MLNRSHLRFAVVLLGLCIGALMARTMFLPGIIGYVDDWNIPATPHGLWVWGISDFSPWRPIEYGLPMAYPTDFYLKTALALASLSGLATHLIVALFLTGCFALAFTGMVRLSQRLWTASAARSIAAGLLYVSAPVVFDSLVPGYLTFILSYAMLPWLAVALLRASGGERRWWFGYGLIFALSLAQVQFVIFDVVVSIALLIALRSSAGQWGRAALFAFCGGVLAYSFVVVNLLGDIGLVSTATRWSRHSWTSLNAPGIVNAVKLVPSAYPYFDLSLGTWNAAWHVLALVLVAYAFVAAIASRRAAAYALAVVLIGSLVMLHGPNPPLTGPMTRLLDLGPMAILRNLNYVFALVSFSLAALAAAPLFVRSGVLTAALVAFGFLWCVPFLANTYAQFVAPVPGPNPTASIVGEANRTLVLPHLQVVDPRRPSAGGVNPNSVETITPIFVRDTPTGILQAALLDRLTDWTPAANTFVAGLQAARVNAIALQTELGSTFPRYVYADLDQWMNESYETTSFAARLNSIKGLAVNVDGSTATYATGTSDGDVQTAGSASAVNGSVEDEIAARAAGYDGIFVPAQAVSSRSSWVSGLVADAGSPQLVASPDDLRDGAYMLGGDFANRRTTDWHVDWVDAMVSSNWWYDVRLLAEPHSAITDERGAKLTVPLAGPGRHVIVQYYVSPFGGAFTVAGLKHTATISSYATGFGAYRWADLGTVPASAPALRVTSQSGFNAIGGIYAVTPAQERRDRARFAAFAARGLVEIVPNLTFNDGIHFTVPSGWHPDLTLTNISGSGGVRLGLALTRRANRCSVQVISVQFDLFTISLDGRPAALKPFSLGAVPCERGDSISVDGTTLGSQPAPVRATWPALPLTLARRTTAGTVRSSIPLTLDSVPLAGSPAAGTHAFAIRYRPLFSNLQSWTSGFARSTSQGEEFDVYHDKTPVDTGVQPRAFAPGERVFLTGSYVVTKGAVGSLMFFNADKAEARYDFPGDGAHRTFHWDLSTIPRAKGDWLFVGLDPRGRRHATMRMTLHAVAPAISANLVLADSRFRVSPERQLTPQTLHFLRYRAGPAGRVVQYDQTFDPGWASPGASEHVQSTSGFNVWAFPGATGSRVIRYRTGVPYAIALVFSCIVVVLLAVMTLVLPDGRTAA